MKNALALVIAFALGFGISQYFQKTEKHFSRLDAVTLKPAELDSLVQAINIVKERSTTDRTYFRYETNTGSLAFDCPTLDGCNLEVPAREAQKPKEWHRTVQTDEQLPMPGEERVVNPQAVPRKKLSYSDLGLHNGDVITAINGKAIDSPSFAFTELQKLLNESGSLHDLTILRDGQNVNLSFNSGDSS